VNVNDPTDVPAEFKAEFEQNMQELVKRGHMRQTGPGTYALTDAGEAYVESMGKVGKPLATAIDKITEASREFDQKIQVRLDDLVKAAKATLMFHQGGPWSQADRETWLELTGRDEASTRTLCDFVREQLGKAGAL
jgi:predicted transcriptional regulator